MHYALPPTEHRGHAIYHCCLWEIGSTLYSMLWICWSRTSWSSKHCFEGSGRRWLKYGIPALSCVNRTLCRWEIRCSKNVCSSLSIPRYHYKGRCHRQWNVLSQSPLLSDVKAKQHFRNNHIDEGKGLMDFKGTSKRSPGGISTMPAAKTMQAKRYR